MRHVGVEAPRAMSSVRPAHELRRIAPRRDRAAVRATIVAPGLPRIGIMRDFRRSLARASAGIRSLLRRRTTPTLTWSRRGRRQRPIGWR